MRRKLVCIFITLSLLLSMIPGVLAADPKAMTDIRGHWAEETIHWCMEKGLFQGTTDTTFEPETATSRGMFVTVLSRIQRIQESEYANSYVSTLYSDVAPAEYYAIPINWATRMGIVKGVGGGRFDPNAPITREDMATILVRYINYCDKKLTGSNAMGVGAFSDAGSIADYAAGPVDALKETGIINGEEDGNGTYRFNPKNNATRAECAAVFQRLSATMAEDTDKTVVAPTGISVTPGIYSLKVGQTVQLSATIQPSDATNQTVTWVSTNPAVATVDQNGLVTVVGEGNVELYAYTWNGLWDGCYPWCYMPRALEESYADKCMRIFGQVVDNHTTFYGPGEAAAYMTTVTVPVWNFTDSSHTAKYATTATFTCHANLAPVFQAIFQEIFNGPEQFPIYSVGCYRAEAGSEHNVGMAVDINPDENCMQEGDGTVSVGSYWMPGVDPYSIPEDGDVVRAFENYGFGWGGYGWSSGRRDFMHFSYFGW